MSTYPTTIRARASSLQGRSAVVWAALGAALIGAVLALVLVLAVSDDKTTSRSQPAAPDIRFDGGPNEGTRGAAVLYTSNTRFDGGPQEGTRGETVLYSTSTRFDGGPNEGTRGR
jgi:hypothetical protein